MDVPITSHDPIEILGNPNVSTILLPQIKTEDDFNIDFNVTGSQIVWDEDNTDFVPLEFDTDKIVMTDDRDVILTESDNMQVEQKPLIASEDSIMLPLKSMLKSSSVLICGSKIVDTFGLPNISIGSCEVIGTSIGTRICVFFFFLFLMLCNFLARFFANVFSVLFLARFLYISFLLSLGVVAYVIVSVSESPYIRYCLIIV